MKLQKLLFASLLLFLPSLSSCGGNYPLTISRDFDANDVKAISVDYYDNDIKPSGKYYYCFYQTEFVQKVYDDFSTEYVKKENKIEIFLNKKDIEILEKINKEIENSRPVKIYKRSDGHDDMAKMRANSSTMKKDLAHYNIVPAKTFILKPPEFLDKQYAISYIRGYFDGDGSIYLSRNNPIWRICSASRPILEWMRTYFAEEYGIINNKIYNGKDPANNDFYVLQYSSKDKLKKLYDVLYAPGGLYLQRKYDRFTQLVK